MDKNPFLQCGDDISKLKVGTVFFDKLDDSVFYKIIQITPSKFYQVHCKIFYKNTNSFEYSSFCLNSCTVLSWVLIDKVPTKIEVVEEKVPVYISTGCLRHLENCGKLGENDGNIILSLDKSFCQTSQEVFKITKTILEPLEFDWETGEYK